MNKPTSRPAAAMPLDVDLPERVIDQLVADSGFTYQDPDEQDVYALARAIKAEVLARIPRSALAVPQPVGDLHAEHWRLLTELPTKSERYPVAHRGGIGGHAYFVTEADARPSLPAGWQQMPDWGPTHWCDAPGRHAAAALVAAPQPVARVLRPVARVEQRNYFPTVAASRASPSLMWMIPYPEVRQIPDGTVLYAIPLADASAPQLAPLSREQLQQARDYLDGDNCLGYPEVLALVEWAESALADASAPQLAPLTREQLQQARDYLDGDNCLGYPEVLALVEWAESALSGASAQDCADSTPGCSYCYDGGCGDPLGCGESDRAALSQATDSRQPTEGDSHE